VSVRLSVTSQSFAKMAEPRIMQTTAYGSPGADAKDFGKIPMGSPPVGAPNSGGVGLDRLFSTNISLYLRNSAR